MGSFAFFIPFLIINLNLHHFLITIPAQPDICHTISGKPVCCVLQLLPEHSRIHAPNPDRRMQFPVPSGFFLLSHVHRILYHPLPVLYKQIKSSVRMDTCVTDLCQGVVQNVSGLLINADINRSIHTFQQHFLLKRRCIYIAR